MLLKLGEPTVVPIQGTKLPNSIVFSPLFVLIFLQAWILIVLAFMVPRHVPML